MLDCRGATQKPSGIGPGGGLAIGEAQYRESFLLHTPQDRKFEAKVVLGKHVCLIGQSVRAGQFASEYLEQFGEEDSGRLTWVIRPDRRHDNNTVENALKAIDRRQVGNINVIESPGVEQIQRNDLGQYLLKFVRDDDSTVEMKCDAVVSLTCGRPIRLSMELREEKLPNITNCQSFLTHEPGYYVLRGGDVEEGAGVGLADAFL